MRRPASLAWILAGLWLASAATPAAAAGSVFSDWAAVVVAGDWKGSGGGPTEAFDNARRDVARALQDVGFEAENVRQFSVRPERYRAAGLGKSDLQTISEALADLTRKTSGGCLVYFTSHGVPQGVLVGARVTRPGAVAAVLDRTCGARPTVVVISACYSGAFVRPLARPNRMVLTAARSDRTSFGCGETDRYPYFDDCFLQAIRDAPDFAALAGAVRACVRAREVKEGVGPPSEPQTWIGAGLRPLLPLYGFAGRARGRTDAPL